MSRFTFIHAADIHLDSPLLNLERYDGAPIDEVRGAVRRALERLVELALAEKVRFLLIAGDLYDGDCRDFNTPRFFRNKMAELGDAGIDVFIVQGNHDAQNRMERAFRLQLPDNVRVFSPRAAETAELEDVEVAIHGQGFATEAVTEDLSLAYPRPKQGWLNIGLLHTNVGGRPGHDDYAPSTMSGLTEKGYDYWALGHIHKREVLRDGEPWIVYSGSIQGRHVNESDERGCALVTVEDGQISGLEWRDLDVLRWKRCAVDARDCASASAVLAKTEAAIADLLSAAGDRLLAVRVAVTGASPAHRDLAADPALWAKELRERAIDRFQDRVWLEKIELRTRAIIDLDALPSDDPLVQIVRASQDPTAVRAALTEVREDLEEMLGRIPPDSRLTRLEGALIDFEKAEDLEQLAEDVREILIPRLLESGGER